jgi:hypothetical protein
MEELVQQVEEVRILEEEEEDLAGVELLPQAVVVE